jgi:hypothetical protein
MHTPYAYSPYAYIQRDNDGVGRVWIRTHLYHGGRASDGDIGRRVLAGGGGVVRVVVAPTQ